MIKVLRTFKVWAASAFLVIFVAAGISSCTTKSTEDSDSADTTEEQAPTTGDAPEPEMEDAPEDTTASASEHPEHPSN